MGLHAHSAHSVKATDDAQQATHAEGTTVPTDGVAGYAKGCIFIKTDATDESTLRYTNIGTAASANFNLDTIAGD